MAIPLRGGLDLLVEDDGHHAVSSPGAATNDDTVVGDDLKLPGNVRAQDTLPRRNVDDRGVVGEVVAGLYAAVGLPRQLNAEVSPVAHSRGLTTGVVDELSVVPIQGDLVAHIRGRIGADQGAADAGPERRQTALGRRNSKPMRKSQKEHRSDGASGQP